MSRTFLLQDWTTIRSALTQTFVQDPACWLDLDGFADVTCWVDIAEVTPPPIGAGANWLNLQLQTAPSCDDAYFVPMAPALRVGTAAPLTQASTVPTIVRSAKTTVSNNMMRYLRWAIVPVGSGTWDITFRVRAVAARSTTFVPPLLPNCVVWFRADLGLALSGATSSVTAWNDQSGTNDANKNLTTASVSPPTLNASDASYNGQPTINFVNANSVYMTSNLWLNMLNQPDTWVIVGHNTSSGIVEVVIDGNDRTSGQNIQRTAANQVLMFSNGASLTYASAWTTASAALFEYNGVASNIFFNTLTTPSATGNAGSGVGSGQGSMTVGCANAAWGPGAYWDGPVAEIIGYSGLLTQTSKSQLRKLLERPLWPFDRIIACKAGCSKIG